MPLTVLDVCNRVPYPASVAISAMRPTPYTGTGNADQPFAGTLLKLPVRETYFMNIVPQICRRWHNRVLPVQWLVQDLLQVCNISFYSQNP
jgi:hypothetical protein